MAGLVTFGLGQTAPGLLLLGLQALTAPAPAEDVESAIFQALRALVSGRCYPDVAPHGAAVPYITYQQVGGQPVEFLENELPSKKNGRFQINTWAATRIASAALARQVESAMVGATTFQARPLIDFIAAHNDDLRLSGSIQDFTVWSDR